MKDWPTARTTLFSDRGRGVWIPTAKAAGRYRRQCRRSGSSRKWEIGERKSESHCSNSAVERAMKPIESAVRRMRPARSAVDGSTRTHCFSLLNICGELERERFHGVVAVRPAAQIFLGARPVRDE